MEADEAQVYRVKRVSFRGLIVPIVCQNVNGPCPLIAICNVLLLRGAIRLHADYSRVTFSALSNLVVDYLMEATSTGNVNVQYNVNDVIGLMPSLQFGLDVNVRFNSIVDFEFTQNQLVFDLLGIRLVHGWLVDPQDTATSSVIDNLSYNTLVERIIKLHDVEHRRQKLREEQQEEDPAVKEQHDAVIKEGLVIEEFLTNSAGQLTYHGLHQLHEQVRDQELCVLFRNNHFATLLRTEGQLFVLVTDVGYIQEPVVWEKLCEIDGDNVLLDAEFRVPQRRQPPPPPPPAIPASDPASQEEADRLLALRLSDAERRAATRATVPVPNIAGVEGLRASPAHVREQQLILEGIQRGRPGSPPRRGRLDDHEERSARPKPKKCCMM